MAILNAVQRAHWERLRVLEQQTGALHLALRRLAMELIAKMPDLSIEIPDARNTAFPLKTFKNTQEKNTYIAKHSRNGEWATSEIFFVLANALGYYKAKLNVDKGGRNTYDFEQNKNTGLTIEIDNLNNTHWQLTGATTKADGNCLFHAMAQQIEKDSAKKAVPYSCNIVASTQKPVRSHTSVKDSDEYKRAYRKLEQLSTSELIAVYQQALSFTDGDTYLRDRPKYVKQEQGSDILDKALDNQPYDLDFDYIVREELVHMLAVEAWRNPRGTDELEKHLRANDYFDAKHSELPLTRAIKV